MSPAGPRACSACAVSTTTASSRALRGEVEVTVDCAGAHDRFTATMSPFFLGDDGLVFRRGPGLRGRTSAFDASKSAADIDRELVRAVADPAAEVQVTIRELGGGDRRGALFVVSVPIGNDDDLSPRARRVLEVRRSRPRGGHAPVPRPDAARRLVRRGPGAQLPRPQRVGTGGRGARSARAGRAGRAR